MVIGAGPAGLSAAIEASKRGFSVLLLDKGAIVNSIQNFPVNMTFFSTAELLEIAGVPFTSSSSHPSRTEAVNYYTQVAKSFRLEFKPNSQVLSIRREPDSHFRIEIKNELTSELSFVSADNIVVATGFYDNPNLLGIPGENLFHVSHYYREAGSHFGQKVVVIGGKNSAVEAALDLFRHGVEVTMICRGEKFGENVKYWILPDIQNRVKNREIRALFGSRVVEIKPGEVVVETEGKSSEIDGNFVYALTGYHPSFSLLKEAGVEINDETGVPNHNQETLESNVRGVFVAGSLVAGFDCNKIFIENGREHGKLIAETLLNRRKG